MATLEEAAKHIRAPFSPAHLGDSEKVVDQAWSAILCREEMPQDALEQVATQVDVLLKGVSCAQCAQMEAS